MKCLILAGGKGERLWPLSRSDFPKQFIQVQKNHSLFQETIARNLPFCDEFIIATNWEYRSIIANQMKAFQGVPYRCVFEEQPRKTTAAIILACMDLQPAEFVFVVAADHLIGTKGYKEAILTGKEAAGEGSIVLFGKKTEIYAGKFGYISDGKLYEKPENGILKELKKREALQNIGLILFQNAIFFNEMKRLQGDIFDRCSAAFGKKQIHPEGVLYETRVLETIPPVSIEKSLLEKTEKLASVTIDFSWDDIGSLEDLKKTQYEAEGIGIIAGGNNTTVLNQSSQQAVVVNGLDDVLVVNTADAVYVGKKGTSTDLKGILHEHQELKRFSEAGSVTYRQWGYREKIIEEGKYRIQRVTVLPGKTIYEHKHAERTENWTIIQGSALITLDGRSSSYKENECVEARAGVAHQISNNGVQDLILIETAVGEVLHHDMITAPGNTVTETALGLRPDPIVMLTPVFKDSLWGGTKLRDVYGKHCDYNSIAESWELSAHPAGNCTIGSGRHSGMSFSRYLETVGKEVLGWKCAPLQAFPLLIKLIDAKENLSVQVHPNDDYALRNENEYGKNELWYVVETDPGAGLYVGFNRDVSREEVEQRVADGSILDILNYYPTKTGDVFFIPAGTVHAIGAGNLICEIQQSSNITYRLYDYGRRDQFGNTRELHLKKALDVLDYRRYESSNFAVSLENGQKQILCKYFETTILAGESSLPLRDDSFYTATCIQGGCVLEFAAAQMQLNTGDTVFLPAANGVLNIGGEGSVLITRV